ncbi:MAG TPA: secretin N-terminal domain-containing protein [Gallionellaceae bacterium]|nr:secretin N-terminal domain-containing protein [Gallionellaceae bacterium]
MHRLNMQFKRNATLFLLAVAILAGCAGQRLHEEGMTLLEEGRSEEGLVKLAEASKADPKNLSYRTALARNREQVIRNMLVNANNERTLEHFDEAQKIYDHALRIDPDSSVVKAGMALLDMDRRHARIIAEAAAILKKGDMDEARAALKPVLLENPRSAHAILLQRQIEEQAAKALLTEPTLQAQFRKPVTLQFRDANLKMVFEALSRTSGINVLLDKDVRADLKTSIFVRDVSVEDAIDLILLQSQLEKKIISDNTVFVYPNTPAKLKDYQDLKIRSFHLTNADPKQMLTLLKTLLKTKDILVNEKTNSIVMRDTPEAIRLAEKMIADQDVPDPEVMLEVEVLEVSTSRLSELGIKWPSSFALSTPGTANTLGQLRELSSNDLVASSLSATLNLMLQDGNTNLLASPRIRVRNHEKAKIMIGDRVPVITNAVTPLATGSPVVTGSVQYLDVGMKLEVEPEIHLDNDVSIKINLDVSSIVKQINIPSSGTQAYQIGTRNASTVLRLKDGETQILAGLINDQDRKTADKVPGLGQMPVLGRLFSSHKDETGKTEIVLSITPRIVGKNFYPDAREVEYWSGTESNLRSNSFVMKSLGSVGFGSAPPASPATSVQPAPGNAPPSAAYKPVVEAKLSTAVLSWSGPDQARVGDRISLTLNNSAPLGAKSLGFQVAYDPSVLKAVEVIEENAMRQNDDQTNFVKLINQKNGTIQVGLSGTGKGEASGGGSIVTVVFEVTGAASSSQILVRNFNAAATGGGALALTAPAPYSVTVTQ